MRGVAEGAELVGGLVQRIEIVEELLFGQFLFGEAPLGLVMGVDEVLHGCSPWLSPSSSSVYARLPADVYRSWISKSCQSSYWGFLVGVWDKCIMPPG